MNFGVISPKIKTVAVITMVEITDESTAPLVITNAKKIVDKVDAVKFTILLPTKIVLINLSYFSSARRKTLPARLLPFALKERSLILLAHEYAVSVAEKKADIITKNITDSSNGTEPSGINSPIYVKARFLILYKTIYDFITANTDLRLYI